jgi:hypothetical protein
MTSSETPFDADAIRLETLAAQLERMRAMQYKYSDLFYKLIIAGFFAVVLMTMASLTETLRATALLIPFVTIFVGLKSAYFLSYVVLARIYATGIEQRINRALGADVLIAHRWEAAYLFPLGGKEFAGITPRLKQTFIGFMTVHYFIFGAAAIALSAYRAWQLIPSLAAMFPPVRFYFPALIAWSLLHLVYLIWYFGSRRDEMRVMQIVGATYAIDYDAA